MTSSAGTVGRPARKLGKPIKRRWYIVVLCLLAGLGVAFLVSSRTPPEYLAEAVVVVPAISENDPPPGSPDAAARLATTYATLIPLDDAVIAAAATKAGVDAQDLRDSLTVASDPGTALIRIDVLSQEALVAVDSATAVAATVTRPAPPGQIAKGALQLVTVPTEATKMGESRSSSLFIGGVLGLLVGLLAAFALERSDRRIDSVDDLAELLGTPATAWADITPAEARALAYRWRALSGIPAPEVAVVATHPMSREDVKQLLASLGPDSPGGPAPAAVGGRPAAPPSQELVRGRNGEDSGDIGVVAVGAPGSGEGAELRAQMSDLVVMVVREGTRVAVARDNLVRLGEYGVEVVWGLLAPSRASIGSAALNGESNGSVSLSDRLGQQT
ncbi:MAG: hypothetical protein AB7O74_09520 [Candidatus Nanopelagicales bacterium]